MNAILDTLGTIGETLDRPGAALRGLLAGRPGQLGYLVPGAETMGLVDPSERTSGRDLLRRWGLAGDEDTLGNFLGGMATEVALNPLPLMAGLGAKLGSKLLAGGSRYKDLRSLRQGFPVAYDVDPHADTIGRIVGGTGPDVEHRAMVAAGDLLDQVQQGDRVLGQFMPAPGPNAGAVLTGAPATTGRHEIIHGMIANAAQAGPEEIAKLPMLARPAAKMYQVGMGSNSTFPMGLGQIADEVAAQALENRGLLGQMGGAAKFLFNRPKADTGLINLARRSRGLFGNAETGVDMTLGNLPTRDYYHQLYDQTSPMAAELFRQVGWVPATAAGAGLGGLGAWGLTGRGQ